MYEQPKRIIQQITGSATWILEWWRN